MQYQAYAEWTNVVIAIIMVFMTLALISIFGD